MEFKMPKPYDNYIEYINHTIVIPDNQPYVAIDLFAGCGGLSLGFEAAGIKTIGYEMVGDFCETYRRNLHTECYNKKISVNTEYPKVRILIGGPPCQPFSRRGKQKGQSDERNGFPAFIEAVKQINPDIWICENVKGLPELNTDYFQSIIDELEIMLGDAARKCCFVTAFENQAAYRSCPEDLAWETEVWVATQPDHMIHLNGSRFQGPYERSNKVL